MYYGAFGQSAVLHVGQNAGYATAKEAGLLTFATLPIIGDQQAVDAVPVVCLIGNAVCQLHQPFKQRFVTCYGLVRLISPGKISDLYEQLSLLAKEWPINAERILVQFAHGVFLHDCLQLQVLVQQR